MKLYPVIIHKDRKSAFGVTVPDLPGCFSAGATLDEALRNVQDAVEVHLYGEDIAPEPTEVDRWKSDPRFREAYVVTLAPVDLSPPARRPVSRRVRWAIFFRPSGPW